MQLLTAGFKVTEIMHTRAKLSGSTPKHNWWELCMTTNNSWGGFQFKDQNWKTPYEVITIFADVISNGGNLLLDIGPKEDGTFPPEQINILKELGQWNKNIAKQFSIPCQAFLQGIFTAQQPCRKIVQTYIFSLPETHRIKLLSEVYLIISKT